MRRWSGVSRDSTGDAAGGCARVLAHFLYTIHLTTGPLGTRTHRSLVWLSFGEPHSDSQRACARCASGRSRRRERPTESCTPSPEAQLPPLARLQSHPIPCSPKHEITPVGRNQPTPTSTPTTCTSNGARPLRKNSPRDEFYELRGHRHGSGWRRRPTFRPLDLCNLAA